MLDRTFLKCRVVVFAAFALFNASCKQRVDGANMLASAPTPGPNGLLPPPAGTDGNHIKIDVVLKAWNEEAAMFYGKPPTGYAAGTPEAPITIDEEMQTGPVQRCFGSCPTNYSTLVCHYFCWHPSYKKVSPNIRGCFTNIIQKRINVPNAVGLDNYPNIFDYCMYQDFDISTKPIPPYDANIIATNKANDRSGGRVGVLKYMSPEQEEVFKYLMFTWWNPKAFDFDDQQDILNKFYATQKAAGVTTLTAPTVSRTGTKLTQWETPMKNWDKTGSLTGTPTTPTVPAPTTPTIPSPTPGQLLAGTYTNSTFSCPVTVTTISSSQFNLAFPTTTACSPSPPGGLNLQNFKGAVKCATSTCPITAFSIARPPMPLSLQLNGNNNFKLLVGTTTVTGDWSLQGTTSPTTPGIPPLVPAPSPGIVNAMTPGVYTTPGVVCDLMVSGVTPSTGKMTSFVANPGRNCPKIGTITLGTNWAFRSCNGVTCQLSMPVTGGTRTLSVKLIDSKTFSINYGSKDETWSWFK